MMTIFFKPQLTVSSQVSIMNTIKQKNNMQLLFLVVYTVNKEISIPKITVMN